MTKMLLKLVVLSCWITLSMTAYGEALPERGTLLMRAYDEPGQPRKPPASAPGSSSRPSSPGSPARSASRPTSPASGAVAPALGPAPRGEAARCQYPSFDYLGRPVCRPAVEAERADLLSASRLQDDYDSAAARRTAGKVIVGVGTGLSFAGIAMTLSQVVGKEGDYGVLGAGAGISVLSFLIAHAVGIPLWVSGGARMDRIRKQQTARLMPNLSAGVARDGGIAAARWQF